MYLHSNPSSLHGLARLPIIYMQIKDPIFAALRPPAGSGTSLTEHGAIGAAAAQGPANAAGAAASTGTAL